VLVVEFIAARDHPARSRPANLTAELLGSRHRGSRCAAPPLRPRQRARARALAGGVLLSSPVAFGGAYDGCGPQSPTPATPDRPMGPQQLADLCRQFPKLSLTSLYAPITPLGSAAKWSEVVARHEPSTSRSWSRFGESYGSRYRAVDGALVSKFPGAVAVGVPALVVAHGRWCFDGRGRPSRTYA
jgi:hypothetical protein